MPAGEGWPEQGLGAPAKTPAEGRSLGRKVQKMSRRNTHTRWEKERIKDLIKMILGAGAVKE